MKKIKYIVILLILIGIGIGIKLIFVEKNNQIDIGKNNELNLNAGLNEENKIYSELVIGNNSFALEELEVEKFQEENLIELEYFKGVYRLIYDYDENNDILMFNYEDQTLYFDFSKSIFKLNNIDITDSKLIISKLGTLYINLDLMKEMFKIEYNFIEEPFFILSIDMNDGELNEYTELKNIDNIKSKLPSKLMLTWEAVYSKTVNVSKLYEMEGLNIISPVWYDLVDGEGTIKSKISQEYIDWSKNMGYDLWPSVTNNFDMDMTRSLLTSYDNRTKFINELLLSFKEYDFEGINIDFENMYKEDSELLSLFIAELTSAFHRENILVSMDVTFAGGSDTWSKCYDRKILSQWVDYIIVMAYDEHWGSSPTSGSVASLNWVEDNVQKLLTEVDSEKLILGIPFYMRVWFERPSKDIINNMKVTSDAITMYKMEEILSSNEHNVLWDEPAGQYYISFIDSNANAVKKIWIEDETSLKLKVDLVHKYNLKGIASWRRGYELESIWKVLNEALRK